MHWHVNSFTIYHNPVFNMIAIHLSLYSILWHICTANWSVNIYNPLNNSDSVVEWYVIIIDFTHWCTIQLMITSAQCYPIAAVVHHKGKIKQYSGKIYGVQTTNNCLRKTRIVNGVHTLYQSCATAGLRLLPVFLALPN